MGFNLLAGQILQQFAAKNGTIILDNADIAPRYERNRFTSSLPGERAGLRAEGQASHFLTSLR
jgi:hypothetical protein